ncbi:MAG: protein translocase subunit SecF [Ancrocorticia sp.]|uniref:protein translocase subunit SecF n=1 Tax=Ancrocorticia sp. TaxID=2593684 RepID=UPI003F90234F
MSMYNANDLYTGKKSYDIIGKRKLWFSIAALAVIVSITLVFTVRLNLGIEFTGGSQFTVSNTQNTDQQPASNVMSEHGVTDAARVAQVGETTLRVQTVNNDEFSNVETEEIRNQLADAYDVDGADVTSTFIGPSWGQDILGKAMNGFVVFLVLVGVGLSLYFRSWRNAAGAIIALFHDLIVTLGVYCAFGFEVTPSTVIGLLTILGYSLYDTVVVFDKVRENTADVTEQSSFTFAESTNLAVNQTLIRSINTSMTSLLPVGSILFIGVLLLGAGTLRDLALVMFIGLLLSTISSIYIASPIAVTLAQTNQTIKDHTQKVLTAREERGDGEGGDDDSEILSGAGPNHGVIRRSGVRKSNSAQPKRKKRSKK